nr:transposase [Moraxella osloensis]
MLENELPSTEEENIQPSTISDEATILAGKPVRKKSNARNGTTKKTVLTDFGHIELDVPRDRECSFDPERGNSKVSLRPSARRRLCLSNC